MTMASPAAFPCRVAIAGASSLRGRELKSLLEERGFPAGDIRLFDDEIAAGTLTETSGEPTFIIPVTPESFQGVRFAFFAGSSAFTSRYWAAARRAGSIVIDLSGALAAEPSALPWIPALENILPPPPRPEAFDSAYIAPGAPAIAACTLAAALGPFSPQRLAIAFFQPVSERGPSGIEELESQTVNLLSLKPFGQDVFDAQVAFNLLGSYGGVSYPPLADDRTAIAREVSRYLAERVPLPAIQLIHAPVFHGHAFLAYAELPVPVDASVLDRAFVTVGAEVSVPDSPDPSNVSVAGTTRVSLARTRVDPDIPTALWLWGAVDNLRLPASNALSIAERLLAS